MTLRKGDPDLNLDIPTIDDDDNAPLGAIVARIARSPGGWYLIAGSRGMDIEQSTESLLIAVNDNDSADVRLSVSPNPVAEGAEVTGDGHVGRRPGQRPDGAARAGGRYGREQRFTARWRRASRSLRATRARAPSSRRRRMPTRMTRPSRCRSARRCRGVRAGNPSSVTVAIVDDDKPTPTVSLSAPLTVVAGIGGRGHRDAVLAGGART